MRRLLESLRSFCHYLGQADRWHRPASGDSSANRSHHMMVWANFIASPGAIRHTCRANRSKELLDLIPALSLWLLLPADGTSGSERGCEESAWAKTGQIILLHKPTTNEGEDGARRCYVIKFRSGGRS